MNPSLLVTTAFEHHITDHRRHAASALMAAAGQRVSRAPRRPADRVAIRMAGTRDLAALRRLAELDSAAPLSGDALLAEVDGELVAAVELGGGRLVADPFRATADIAGLLRMRRDQLAGADGRRGLRSRWHLRRERARAVALADGLARR